MKPGMRERIVQEGNLYKVLNTTLVFSASEIQAELEAHPEYLAPMWCCGPFSGTDFAQPRLRRRGWRTSVLAGAKSPFCTF
ncbi:MAG: hypothetical protein IPH31_22115 [Lewinellaceae bacterium]|nr:hypothetical protein [Lewinellaceae bacterium]